MNLPLGTLLLALTALLSARAAEVRRAGSDTLYFTNQLPAHVRKLPIEHIRGNVTAVQGGVIVVTAKRTEVLPSRTTTTYQRVNGKMTPISNTTPGGTRLVDVKYTVYGYPKASEASTGDTASFAVVSQLGPAGTRTAYYVPNTNVIRKVLR